MVWHKAKKVGIALSGGSARGLAHIGVLEVLEKEGIPVHMLAGTSAGALVGALYAREMDASLIKRQTLSLDWIRLTALVDLAPSRSGFISGKKLTRLLSTFLGGDIKFDELKIPFVCVAADILTGEEVVLKEGSVLEAVRASISIPVIFKAVRWHDRFLVDGELVNPVPVDLVKEMGADFVIAVNVIPEIAEITRHAKKQPKTQKEPGIFTVIANSFYMRSHVLAEICSAGADAVIKPRLAHIGPFDLLHAEEVIRLGGQAAMESMAEIKRKLR